MTSLRFLIYLSFLSFLLSSTVSAVACPKVSVQASNPSEEFVVFLKSPAQAGVAVAKGHFEVLTNCLGRHVVDLENLPKEVGTAAKGRDKNLIVNYPIKTKTVYSGFF